MLGLGRKLIGEEENRILWWVRTVLKRSLNETVILIVDKKKIKIKITIIRYFYDAHLDSDFIFFRLFIEQSTRLFLLSIIIWKMEKLKVNF